MLWRAVCDARLFNAWNYGLQILHISTSGLQIRKSVENVTSANELTNVVIANGAECGLPSRQAGLCVLNKNLILTKNAKSNSPRTLRFIFYPSACFALLIISLREIFCLSEFSTSNFDGRKPSIIFPQVDLIGRANGFLWMNVPFTHSGEFFVLSEGRNKTAPLFDS
jgi:hypothetical protein